jgi:hypothetical protein
VRAMADDGDDGGCDGDVDVDVDVDVWKRSCCVVVR